MLRMNETSLDAISLQYFHPVSAASQGFRRGGGGGGGTHPKFW